MLKALIPPNENKPGLVLRWIRKVSENEIKNIHGEMVKVRISDRSLKRKLCLSFENYDSKQSSDNSQESEISSRLDSERMITTPPKKIAPHRIINYNAVGGENNSACSKTSSNTKASPNVLMIPLKGKKMRIKGATKKVLPFKYKGIPRIVSIDPGTSIVLKFEKHKSDSKEDQIKIKCKRNIFNKAIEQDIIVENLDDKPEKERTELIVKPQHLIDHPINIFSSINDEQPAESFNLHWGVQNESQDIQASNNYLKPEGGEGKYLNLDPPNISQMIESAEGIGDFYMNRPLLSVTNDNMKSYHMGGPSILNQFCNNATPVFSINEDLGDNIRPNILESDVGNENLDVPSNLPPFVINGEGEMMLTEEFKPPIDTHNQ
mmetsp:Transcript_23068/g.25613  ORF Transcript_23068/g.25613 Transcript_23068/m.25613 type:complete len:377 (+) Transcript_23068:684-1814(+)